MDESFQIGPQARKDFRDTLHRQVGKSIELGAHCLLGGKITSSRGNYYPLPSLRNISEENTPYQSYVARAKAALKVDYLEQLDRIDVPTLIITPEHDTLIDDRASKEMLDGILDVREVVLRRTGHMLRFSHPVTYAETVLNFLMNQFGDDLQAACS